MIYEHLCTACNKEFEDEYSIHSDPPTKCPLCGVEGQVQRLISGSGKWKGTVQLTGQDLKDKIATETAELKREFNRNPELRANLIGPDRYNSEVSAADKYNANRPKIRSRRKSGNY